MSVYNKSGSEANAIYDIDGTSLTSAYDVSGEQVYGGGIVYDYDDYTISSLYKLSVANCQGIAIDNGVLFQLRYGSGTVENRVCLFNFSNGSDIARDLTLQAGHGDSASFSTEYYSASDEFPLLYITSDATPCVIYVNRVTRSGSTLVRTLSFPSSAGYYAAGAYDFDSGICYLLGYKTNNYTSDGGGTNTTVVSKWDLSNLTANLDGSYTPAFIEQYERPFIYVMQGLTYHDGYIWIASGYGSTASHIYAMNPSTGVIDHTITMPDNIEIEGVQFVPGDSIGTWYMVTGQQNGYYKKITFAIA